MRFTSPPFLLTLPKERITYVAPFSNTTIKRQSDDLGRSLQIFKFVSSAAHLATYTLSPLASCILRRAGPCLSSIPSFFAKGVEMTSMS